VRIDACGAYAVGGAGGSVAKLGSDHVKNPFGVFENVAVLESDDENACGFEERPPLKIIELTRCREMSLAIKFDGQLFRWAVEIEDVIANGMLPNEFATFKL
jgi:hypothetical protein